MRLLRPATAAEWPGLRHWHPHTLTCCSSLWSLRSPHSWTQTGSLRSLDPLLLQTGTGRERQRPPAVSPPCSEGPQAPSIALTSGEPTAPASAPSEEAPAAGRATSIASGSVVGRLAGLVDSDLPPVHRLETGDLRRLVGAPPSSEAAGFPGSKQGVLHLPRPRAAALTFPFMAIMASLASSMFSNVTNPKPRDRWVSRSFTTTTAQERRGVCAQPSPQAAPLRRRQHQPHLPRSVRTLRRPAPATARWCRNSALRRKACLRLMPWRPAANAAEFLTRPSGASPLPPPPCTRHRGLRGKPWRAPPQTHPYDF